MKKKRFIDWPFVIGLMLLPLAILLEALRPGTVPAAIVTTTEDAFFALAGVVAEEMYGSGIPILSVDQAAFKRLETGQQIQIEFDGTVHLDE